MQTTTTLTLKDTKKGTSARGAWKLSIYTGGDGREYTTLKGDLASKVNANDGALFVVQYEERQNGEYTNYGLLDVEVAPEGAKPQAAPSTGGKSGKGEFRTPDQIIRTSAAEISTATFAALGLNPVEDAVGFLEYAVLVEAYIREGIEEEPEA